jgi:lipopolysaccharide biosynthesis glycosyltransferase
MSVLPLFIGYDEREHDAYEVCRYSAERRSSIPLHVVRLDQSSLRRNGWYNREWRYEGDKGQRVDLLDRRPFSTDFSFTRFLVPALALHQGWALYCDCDFLFTADLAGLLALADPQFAVMCVKHRHVPRETSKMNGLRQTAYFRKNWSSLVLWNCEHPGNRVLNSQVVNHSTGQWLHAFQWLTDEQIGELPPKWNWLAGVDAPLSVEPCGIHFTLGIPSLRGCEDTPYVGLWLAEQMSRRTVGRPTPSERLRAIG